MLGSMQISPDDEPSNAFLGVRFVLFGFDSVREDQVRSKLLEGRGIDAVNYGSDCTHVVVDKLVYDDPICAAARRDGKILVSGLWVDHSFDVGMHVDPTSVMYRPVRDLNGIRGAKSLVMCLTGYQRQDRDDIMTMVALMGANFSKPLVANKVTHLICYKFEGEKYELGRKVKTIKLVNHHWLQDCLMAWELLPEADYAKSAYELEMEAEAKDSEEETEDMASVDQQKKSIASPQNAQVGNKNFHLSTLVQEVSRDSAYLTAFESLTTVGNTSKAKSTPTKETDTSNSSCARSPAKMPSKVPSNGPDGKLISEKIDHGLASTSGNAKKSVDGGLPKLTNKNMKASLPLRSERIEKNSCSPLSNVNKSGVDVPLERQLGWPDSHGIKTPLKGILLHSDEGQNVDLHSTKKRTISRGSSRSPVLSHSPKTSLKSGFATKQIEMPVSRSLIDVAYDVSPASCLREEVSGGFVMQSEKDQDGVKTPLKRALVDLMEEPPSSLPGNKKTTVSRGGSKSTKGRCSPKILMGSGSDIKQPELLVSGSSVHGSRQLAVDVLPTNISGSLREEESCAFLRQPDRDQDGVKTPLKGALLHPNDEQISSLDSKKKMNGSSKSEKLSRSPKTSMGSGFDIKATDNSSDLREEVSIFSKEALSISTSRENKFQYSLGRSRKQNLPDLDVNDPSSSRTRPCSGEEEMQQRDQPPFPCTSSRVDKLDGQVDDNGSKQLKKKMLAGKTLGSRPTICKGRNTKHKGLISTVFQKEFTSQSNGALVTKNINNVSLVEKLVAVSPTTNEDVPAGEGIDALECEGPTESFEMEVKNSVVVEDTTHKRKQPSENTTQIKKGAKSKVLKSNEPKRPLCSQKMESPESKSTGHVAEGKIKAAKSKINKLKETKQDQKKIVSCNEEVVDLAGKTIEKPCKKLKGSDDVEKENEPIINGQHSGNSHNLKKPLKNACVPCKANVENLNMKAEPACFILSGHRLQRKEFQQVIRRLKGRACRDTHNWSYQATHFIVPDPIRRTEKFFAAAASGSWILKTDYLTASNEAGRFLSEEPYEWHKKSLTEDGAINLEAPRKWRRLRERTGHGAFYGIRIIIYGECIAPPLETLKRAVKAGDGTIVATSPPYTRALKSKVDFAVVSPGTPRVDMWVQEFVRHEIACVSADYLVEYVCKPGHSLERHVMYNTQAWAERSLESLVSRLEEAVDDPKTPEYDDYDDDDDDADVSCQVCGMHDRGDEMLLCGDESGAHGCGVGTHIDCLDPPLTDVPEEDWFCRQCCRSSINR